MKRIPRGPGDEEDEDENDDDDEGNEKEEKGGVKEEKEKSHQRQKKGKGKEAQSQPASLEPVKAKKQTEPPTLLESSEPPRKRRGRPPKKREGEMLTAAAGPTVSTAGDAEPKQAKQIAQPERNKRGSAPPTTTSTISSSSGGELKEPTLGDFLDVSPQMRDCPSDEELEDCETRYPTLMKMVPEADKLTWDDVILVREKRTTVPRRRKGKWPGLEAFCPKTMAEKEMNQSTEAFAGFEGVTRREEGEMMELEDGRSPRDDEIGGKKVGQKEKDEHGTDAVDQGLQKQFCAWYMSLQEEDAISDASLKIAEQKLKLLGKFFDSSPYRCNGSPLGKRDLGVVLTDNWGNIKVLLEGKSEDMDTAHDTLDAVK